MGDNKSHEDRVRDMSRCQVSGMVGRARRLYFWRDQWMGMSLEVFLKILDWSQA